MKKLLLKILLIGGFSLSCFGYFQLNYLKKNDVFYWKAAISSSSLIIGGSRAKRDIAPHIIENNLGLPQKSLLNFAFNGNSSPYGEKYFKLIKRKIKLNGKNNVYILSVNPMVIMDYKDVKRSREDEFSFYELWTINQQPNIEYLLKNPSSNASVMQNLYETSFPPQKIFLKKIPHSNGWLEGIVVEKKEKKPKQTLRTKEQRLIFSKNREEYLFKTISFLKEKGKVYLVRLPIEEKILKREDILFPNFDKVIEALAIKTNVIYFNFSEEGEDYDYSDGHHLTDKGARKFSKKLAETIKQTK